MMSGYEAAERIAKVLRANGVKDSTETRYGLGYLIENALRYIANHHGDVLIVAGTNANPTLKYIEANERTTHPDPQPASIQPQKEEKQ